MAQRRHSAMEGSFDMADPIVFEQRITTSLDDVEERASGSLNFTSADLELVDDPPSRNDQTVGLRFTSIAIPQGAIITAAYIQFQTDEVSTGAASLTISGEDTDNAALFADVSGNVSSRGLTSASVLWTPADWTTTGEAGVDQRTADLSAIIQEIVSRPGWSVNNAMVFTITGTGTRTAEAYDGVAAAAPLLHVEYVLPEGANLPPVVDLDASTPGSDFSATFDENGPGVAIAAGTLITDPDDTELESAFVAIANPSDGDELVVNVAQLPPGIALQMGPAGTDLILTGTTSIADYQLALSRISFRNSSEAPVAAERVINVVLNDGDANSNTAVSRILINRAPDAVADLVTTAVDTAVITGNTLANDDIGDGPATVTAFDSVSASGGSVSYNGDGTFRYDPPAGFSGTDSFGYTISDADGDTSSATVSATVLTALPQTLEVRVASGLDDVEERASGSVNLNSSDLELVDDPPSRNDQTVGIRFVGISIPQGAIITAAYIQFQTDEVDSGSATLTISGEDADDAAGFSGVANDVSARTSTSASVLWSPAAWTTVGASGLDQRTSDLSSIVQEIVDRPGWAADNAIVLTITGSGTRTAEAFEGNAAAAPLLHIEFLPPGPPSDPVAFDIPADADPSANAIPEDATAGTAVGIIASASDPDAGDTVTYSIDDVRFAIDPNTGEIARSGTGTIDFESEPSLTLTVTATSSDRSTATQGFTLAVLDAQEPVAFDTPADADPSPNRIVSSAAAGAVVGITASATDPDSADTVGYSIDDARFTIDSSGVITRSATGTLDSQSEPVVSLTVTATSSDASSATQLYLLSVQPETSQPLMRFAVFGDFGDSDLAGEQAVAALVDSWNVDFILTAGDNAYGTTTYEQSVGQFYSDYIGDYTGSYGPGSSFNRFFPILGNHDYEDPGAGLAAYLSYFSLPDDERYYDFQVGMVHFFALNSTSDEPDGHTLGSVQAQWLQAALAGSDSAYNVVYFHDTAYTSDGGGDADMRWTFEAWGADATFSGDHHDFDLVLRDDNGDGTALPYVTTGAGGSGNGPSDSGANLVTVTETGLLIEYYLSDGTLWGTYTVDLPADVDPLLFANGNDIMNGTAGSDHLWGLGGDDTLIPRGGNDVMIGGDGSDVFVIGIGDGQNLIEDFAPGAGPGDRLDLRAFGIDTAGAFVQAASNQGSSVVVELGGGVQITLQGVQTGQFVDDDFVSLGPPSDPVAFDIPADADPAANEVVENAPGGTLVGITASATDPDAGSTVTYSIDDDRFLIDAVTGEVRRSGTGTLDFSTEPAITLTVTARSSDFSTATQAYSLSVLDGPATPATFEARVAASGDDVEERASGSINFTSADLELVDDPPSRNDQTVGIRFTGVSIPQGAIITAAYIQFQTDEVSTGPSILTISGEDVDNAAAFLDINGNVSSRTLTSANVQWSPAAWTSAGQAGLDQRTADLSAIVQEIVGRSGWTADNAMVFTITGTGTRTAEAYDGVAAAAPLLHIEYLPPGSASDPVVFDQPADADPTINQIAEAAAAGALVGITASASDPDPDDTVTYTLDDDRFVIDPNTGVVARSSTGALDFETEPSVTITVTATSSDFSHATQAFTLAVANSDEAPLARDDAALTQSGASVLIDVLANDDEGDSPSTISNVTGAFGTVQVNNPDGTLTYTPAAGFTGIDIFDYTITDANGDTASATVTVSVVPPQPPSSLTYVQTINAWQFSPPSPDSAGIVYIAHRDTLIVSDSEVNEIPTLFTGDNLFEVDRATGTLVDSLTTIGFSDEPTGATYNPTNHHLFFTDDTGTRSVYELNPGGDGLYGTADDIVTSFRTSAFGSTDPEGIAYDTTRGVLHIADGAGDEIYTVAPGVNGIFDGVAVDGGDDVVTSFDVTALGIDDPEGIAYDPVYDLLYVVASRTSVAQVTPTGTLVGMLDISAASARNPAGLEIAPSSSDPTQTSLYVVDRGVDNDADPSENDGMIHEFAIDPWLLS